MLSTGTTSKGLPYCTMPYVRGKSLRERMPAGPMPLASAVAVLCDVARAIRAYEQAIDEHHWWMPYVNNDQWSPYLRADPEFRRLMKRLNVPDASL